MMPEGAKIRSVLIYYSTYHIFGFRFFDEKHSLLWQIGYIDQQLFIKAVILAKNEVIVGVVAKVCKVEQ